MAITLPTNALKSYIAQSIANKQAMQFDRIIFAYINGLNDSNLANVQTMPTAAQIKHSAAIQQTGYMNENEVVYSVTLGSEVGDFTFNFVGLVNSQNNLLAVAVHTGEIDKVKTKESEQGNALTRNIILQFNNAKSLTNIRDMAKSWQFDFTNYFLRINPKTLTATSTNSADATGHTHEIAKASTTTAGLTKLNDTLTSTSKTEALTANQGKQLKTNIDNVNSNLTATIGQAQRELTASINQAKSEASNNLNSAKGELQGSINSAKGELQNSINSVRDWLNNTINNVRDGLNSAISEVSSRANPKTLGAGSTNSADNSGHSHYLERASTQGYGITKLYDGLDSASTSEALTARQGKQLKAAIDNANSNASNANNAAQSLRNDLNNNVNSLNGRIDQLANNSGSGGFRDLAVTLATGTERDNVWNKYNESFRETKYENGGLVTYSKSYFLNFMLKATLPKNKDSFMLLVLQDNSLANFFIPQYGYRSIWNTATVEGGGFREDTLRIVQEGDVIYLIFFTRKQRGKNDYDSVLEKRYIPVINNKETEGVARLAIFDV